MAERANKAFCRTSCASAAASFSVGPREGGRAQWARVQNKRQSESRCRGTTCRFALLLCEAALRTEQPWDPAVLHHLLLYLRVVVARCACGVKPPHEQPPQTTAGLEKFQARPTRRPERRAHRARAPPRRGRRRRRERGARSSARGLRACGDRSRCRQAQRAPAHQQTRYGSI